MFSQMQNYFDEYSMILGVEEDEYSAIKCKISKQEIQISIVGTEKIINEFKRFDFIEDLLSGRTFPLSQEGINQLYTAYEDLFKELSFYTNFDKTDLYDLVITIY